MYRKRRSSRHAALLEPRARSRCSIEPDGLKFSSGLDRSLDERKIQIKDPVRSRPSLVCSDRRSVRYRSTHKWVATRPPVDSIEALLFSTLFLSLESVRRLQAGLQSFLSMRRIEARRKNASAFRLRSSQSLASLRQRLSQAMVRSTIQRLGKTTNPLT